MQHPYIYIYMGVSKNGGTTKSSMSKGFSVIIGNPHIYIYICPNITGVLIYLQWLGAILCKTHPSFHIKIEHHFNGFSSFSLLCHEFHGCDRGYPQKNSAGQRLQILCSPRLLGFDSSDGQHLSTVSTACFVCTFVS